MKNFITVCLAVLFLSGCDNPQQNNLKTETNIQSQEEIRKLEQQISTLKGELKTIGASNSSLRKNLRDSDDIIKSLRFQNNQITSTNKELQEWSSKLVKGYGPSVWYFGVYERPVFHHFPAKDDLQTVVSELNKLLSKDGNPTITLDKIENTTAYVRVNDSEHLTQRMGTTGAEGYLNVVTLTLTSLQNVSCVYINFEEGDHAAPGKHCN